MVTIKDVARVADVSPSTVSRVVRGEGKVGKKCRAKVQKVIDEMGYRPNTNARALVSRRSELVGIVTPALHKPFFGSIAFGAETAARQKSFQVMMRNSHNDPEHEIDAINSFREHGCENIILHSKSGSVDDLKDLAEKIPGLVFINRFIPELASRCVWLDNVSGGRMTADYLYSQGHRDIALVSLNLNNDQEERIRGVRQFFQSKGIPIPEENIVEHSPVKDVVSNIEEYCVYAVKELYKRNANFTAIVAYNDEMAVCLMNALFDIGKRVPEDVSVMGFDDLDIAHKCRPALTTIRYPIIEMSEYATKLSLQMTLEKEDIVQRTHLFMPTLVVRKSVKKIDL
ncbi:LacI family DNA-binding transcriptional regulator [Pseudoalteromonas sp. SWXJ133]|uniref:LacI family DNA-binding transcriptional regulator n=1 Tax=unclassified Pseudoalteromonas TaxID=194690 RepID=UPI0003F688FB|nr:MULTISPECIES: LacI family DNA-binding transcriptional regulator [unclassified Pseudoalteromonas]MBH0022397.1 LacI family DNA-binding transcriptional regulator [Pseudoalteromonas sp. SWXJ133]MBH0077004.1 LacI family DNA-binding transcriptional regulator [Pseudoalteromonas sp. SWYJ118]